MLLIRSFMFVPGHRAGMVDKAIQSEADALILDLEDSVPPAEKAAARSAVGARIAELTSGSRRIYVRINKTPHMYEFDDLLAVVKPGLEGIVLSMPQGPEDVALATALLGEAEDRNGVAPGSIAIVPALETPRALQLAYECACAPRVNALIGASARGADLVRAMGLEWTPEGTESLYLKSRVVMACRAAGRLPIGGIWQQVHDLDGLRRYTEADRRLGFAGTTILHPSNAPVVNQVFTISPERVTHLRALIAAYEAAAALGKGSVMFAGEHIDRAHVETARAELRRSGIS